MRLTKPNLHKECAWYFRTATSTCLFQVLHWPLYMFVSHAKFHPGSLVRHIQTTENADRGITINCEWSVSYENACYEPEASPYHCKHHRPIIPSELTATARESCYYPQNKGYSCYHEPDNSCNRYGFGSVSYWSVARRLCYILRSWNQLATGANKWNR